MKNNRVGVVLIVFALATLALVAWLVLQRQHDGHGRQVGAPGAAWFAPNTWLAQKELPFFGLLALAILLPVPLAWLLVRRDLAPLIAIGSQLDQLVGNGAGGNGIGGNGTGGNGTGGNGTGGGMRKFTPRQARDLAGQLQSWLAGASLRIADLEKDRFKAIADGRLLEYGSNKMHAVLHCMPDGLLILDPSGEITFANGKIEHLLGAGYDDVLSTPIDSWCQDGELKALLGRYRSDSAEAGRQASVEFSPRAVPHKRLVAVAQPLVGAQGQMAFGTLVVLRDASREYLALQAGNDFVAHVSHELKSPLNVIAMYAETLQDTAPGDQETRVLSINVIQDEVGRMSSLVNNLLNVSKLETGSMNPQRHRIKLDDLLRDAFNQALPRAESRNIKIDLEVPRELAAVSIDKDLFRIALNNLMTNAIKYNRDGGDVALIAEEGDNDIVITVRDSGIGIAADAQAHVFEKFYRAPDGESVSRGGHGLGLYLTSQIVELHHGRMSFESEVGRGSAFSIHLKKMPPLLQGGNVL